MADRKYSKYSFKNKINIMLARLDDAIVAAGKAGGPIEYYVDDTGKAIKRTYDFKTPNNITNLGERVFYYTFNNDKYVRTADFNKVVRITGQYATSYMFMSSSIKSASFGSLKEISGSNGAYYMFGSCSSLTSVDLSSLTTISGSSGANYMFNNCSKLTSIDLSSLTTISGSDGTKYMFSGCSGITSVDLSSLTTISGSSGASYMFNGCSGLTSVNFSSLSAIKASAVFQYTFKDCKALTELRFPALTTDSFGTSYVNQFNNMLPGVTGCTIHFPASIQAKVEKMTGYPNFGGTNTVVLFDL